MNLLQIVTSIKNNTEVSDRAYTHRDRARDTVRITTEMARSQRKHRASHWFPLYKLKTTSTKGSIICGDRNQQNRLAFNILRNYFRNILLKVYFHNNSAPKTSAVILSNIKRHLTYSILNPTRRYPSLAFCVSCI